MRFRNLPPSFYTVAVQGIDIAANFVAGILIARLLGAEAMGDMVFAFAVAGVLSLLVSFGTGEIAIKMYANREANPSAVITGTSLVVFVGSLASLCVAGVLSIVMDMSTQGVLALFIAVAALCVNGLAMVLGHAILGFAVSQKDVPAIIVARIIFLAGLAVGAVYFSLIVAMLAYVVSGLILTGYRFYIVNKHLFPVRYVFEKDTVVSLLKKGSKLGVATVFGLISGRSDALLIGTMRTPVELGYYGAAQRVQSGVVLGSGAIALALFPGLTRAIHERRKTLGTKAFLIVPLLIAAGSVILALFGTELIVNWLYGKEFEPAIPVLRVLFYTAALRSAHEFLAKYIVACEKERLLPWIKGGSAAINIGVNLILIPLWGAIGAAVATLYSEVFAVGCLIGAVLWIKANRDKPASDPTS